MSSAGWLSSVVNQILICAKKKKHILKETHMLKHKSFLFFFESSCWKAHDWPLEAAPEEVAQMFLKQCWLHRNDIFSQIRYLSTFLPATTFFQCYLLKTRVNMCWEEGQGIIWTHVWTVEKIFEKHGQPNRRLSPQPSASFEPAAKTVCNICNFFEEECS